MVHTLENNLVPYSTATQLAETYAETTAAIRQALETVRDNCEQLSQAFAFEATEHDTTRANFRLEVKYGYQQSHSLGELERVLKEFKREAWSLLFAKLELGKLLSTKRREELNEVFYYGRPRYNSGPDPIDTLPEINGDNIVSVLQGMLSSAGDFLTEKIREEFDYFRPGLYSRSKYKTNQNESAAVGRKVIKGYAVQSGYGTPFRFHYKAEPHFQALDSIFHALDGKGPLPGTFGPLVDSVKTIQEGEVGETDYFRLRCFRNGNIHLEFKRLDLLAEFNRLAGGAALAAPL